MGVSLFRATYGTVASNRMNAFGRCVSQWAHTEHQNQLNARSACTAEQNDASPIGPEPDRQPPPHVLVHAEHPDHRGRVDGDAAGLVVEAHVAAGHRHAQDRAGVRKPAHRRGELPHDSGILR